MNVNNANRFRTEKILLKAFILIIILTGSVAARTFPGNSDLMQAAGLTDDFRVWLQGNGYEKYDFPRSDLGRQGSYGGKLFPDQEISRDPIVFIHGNSDRALGDGRLGWDAQIRFYLGAGYSPAELYATTWGPADPSDAAEQSHSSPYLKRLRAFIEAVLDYTGAEHIDVIAHSMGVTLARKVIIGGVGLDDEFGRYDLGPPLTERIDTFVGIAGANRGLAGCAVARQIETCNENDGFYPGGFSWGFPIRRSDFLRDLDRQPGREGRYVFSVWSPNDEIIGFGNLVYGKITGRIPGQDDEIVILGPDGDHFDLKNKTADEILPLITRRH